MNNSFKHLLLLSALLIGCSARIDIETEDAPERLVIYGYVTNDFQKHAIRITRSSGYFANTPPQGISRASVILSNSEGPVTMEESAEEAGLYLTPTEFAGKEGETYTLEVTVDFDGDGEAEIFEASSYMPFAAQLDSIGLKESTLFDNVIEVLLYGRVAPNDENHFSFHVALNDVILNDSLHGFFIISDEYLVKNEFAGLSCFFLDQEEDDSQLSAGDRVTLFVDVLTPEYADFLDNARSESGGSIPLFGGPPANVETNIRSIYNPSDIPVSGFFSAYSGNNATTFYGNLQQK